MTRWASTSRSSLSGRPFAARLRTLISLSLLFGLQACAAGESKTVLVIYSDERLMAANVAIDSVLRGKLDNATDDQVTHRSEFLDVSRFGSPVYDTLVSDFFRHKYASLHVDVIVAAGDAALQFLSRHRDDLFTGIPVVACAASREMLRTTLPPNYVGVPISVEPLRTIELALRLQPNAPAIVIVTGTSELDHRFEALLRRDVPSLQTRVPIRYLGGLALEDLLKELSHLAPQAMLEARKSRTREQTTSAAGAS